MPGHTRKGRTWLGTSQPCKEGERMTKQELPKAYDFKSTEPRIYAMWEAGGFFRPWNDPIQPDLNPNVEPFVISISPPNVTGELHLGHAMFVSVEDLMIRYQRMKGVSTLLARQQAIAEET